MDIPQHNILIIIGYFNAHLGKDNGYIIHNYKSKWQHATYLKNNLLFLNTMLKIGKILDTQLSKWFKITN